MALRISVTRSGELSVVKIDGSLTTEGLSELLGCIPEEGSLLLDLTDLCSIDSAGAAVIASLKERGADILGASQYIAMLIGLPPVRASRGGKGTGRGIARSRP